MLRFSVRIEGVTQSLNAFLQVQTGIVDLRRLGAWDLVVSTFRRITKRLFDSEGGTGKAGSWAPLKPTYAAVKQKKYGQLPILQATKSTYHALTGDGPHSYVDKQRLELSIGTTLPYPKYHQTGTQNMPARPVVSLTNADETEITEPLARKVKQLIQNAKLAEKQGGLG